MRKTLALCLTILIFCVGLVIFINNKSTKTIQQSTDYIVIYNSKGNKVKKITSNTDVEKVSNIIGNVANNISGIGKKPVRQNFAYHYEIHQVNKKIKIDAYIYADKKIFIKNSSTPLFSKGTWKLNTKEYQTLKTLN